MGEYNKVIMLGNLTRDPDLRYTPTGMPVCEFPLAVHHRYRLNDELKEEVCFIDIVALAQSPSAARLFCKRARKCWWTAGSVKNGGKARKVSRAANTK